MRVTICGSRGSLPVCGEEFTRYGQHTSCVTVAPDDGPPTLILDVGSGVRRALPAFHGGPFRGTILLTHLHWDHVQGLPFLPAADRPDARVDLRIPAQGAPAEEVLGRIMSPPFFPIGPGHLRGAWTFTSFEEGPVVAEGFDVRAREVPHGGGRTMGFRVGDGRASIAYVPDHAPQALGPGEDGLGPYHPAIVDLARDVDLLIHDSQYTADELPERIAWGHSAAEYAVGLAAHSGARRLLLFHHDPCRTDDQLDEIMAGLDIPEGLPAAFAAEGETISL